jgi:hypothetical protein
MFFPLVSAPLERNYLAAGAAAVFTTRTACGRYLSGIPMAWESAAETTACQNGSFVGVRPAQSGRLGSL